MNHLGGQGYSSLGQGGNKRNHVYMAISFRMCTRRKPPRDLEIEHVSRTVASVYSHMLNGLWLSQLHSGRPMHWHLQVNWNCVRELETLHWCLDDKLALCIGRTSMERLCHIIDLSVLVTSQKY